MQSCRGTACLLVLLLCAITPAWALSVTPLAVDMAPSGSGANAVYTLSNPGTDPVAVGITVKRRELNREGVEHLGDAGVADNFVIFPPRVIVPPGEQRAVRLRYVGKQDIERELAYRVIFKQVPLEDMAPLDETGVQVLIQFNTRLFVTPADGASVLAAELQPAEAGAATLLLANAGNKRVYLLEPTITLHGPGEAARTLEGPLLETIRGTLLMAGGERSFLLPADLVAGAEQVSITNHEPTAQEMLEAKRQQDAQPAEPQNSGE